MESNITNILLQGGKSCEKLSGVKTREEPGDLKLLLLVLANLRCKELMGVRRQGGEMGVRYSSPTPPQKSRPLKSYIPSNKVNLWIGGKDPPT